MSNKKVTFTKSSREDTCVTVTANRLIDAGVKAVGCGVLLKGETFSATLTDSKGVSVKTKLVVNRGHGSKGYGSSYVTLKTTTQGLKQPAVGNPVEYTVSNFRRAK